MGPFIIATEKQNSQCLAFVAEKRKKCSLKWTLVIPFLCEKENKYYYQPLACFHGGVLRFDMGVFPSENLIGSVLGNM